MMMPAVGVYCHDASHAYHSEAPAGWVVDIAKGRAAGACAYFYPHGQTFDSAPFVLYPALAPLKAKEDLPAFIAEDLQRFTQKAPTAAVTKLPAVTTAGGLTFETRRIANGPAPTEYELVAYAVADGGVFTQVASARTAEALAKAEPLWRDALAAVKPLAAADLYPTLKARADSAVSHPGGEAYEQSFAKAAEEPLRAALTRCLKPDTHDFATVFVITDDGHVGDWVNKYDNAMSHCVEELYPKLAGPPPPHAPYYVDVTVQTHP